MVTILLGTFLIFWLVQLPPGDFVTHRISEMTNTSGDMAKVAQRLRKYYGFDKPYLLRYVNWVGNLLRGDLGVSLLYRRPIADIVTTQMLWTIIVAGAAYAFAWVGGLLIGIYSALHKYSLADHLLTVLGFVGLSIPSFFVAMVLVSLSFSLGSGVSGGLFSTDLMGTPWTFARVLDLLRHLWIPVLAIGAANMAAVIRFMRGNLIEVLNMPYITTAWGKGLSQWGVVVKHAFRVAVNPLISLAGMQAPQVISGIVVTAVVLDLPIMGPTFLEALQAQDAYLAGTYLLLILLLILIGDIVADVLLGWADPRIRYD